MKIKVSPKQGFTLIELLVVISIIAILAGIALPAFTQVMEKGNQTKALSNAKQIYVGLKLFSGDYDGEFPNKVWETDKSYGAATTKLSDGSTSNDAYRWIVPEYIKSENIFFLAKSKWSEKTPDENTANGEALNKGENHWAYVRDLTDTSNPNFPIIADGMNEAKTGYPVGETAKGGVWKGKAAIVIRVDGSGKVERTKMTASNTLGIVEGSVGATNPDDIFKTGLPNWLATSQKILNPEPL